MTVSQIITAARGSIGVRWRHQGRDENGKDCVGLVITSLQRCGWEPKNPEILELPNYERQARDGSMVELVRAEASREVGTWQELQVGDVVVFYVPGARYPQHMGLISNRAGDSLWLLHSSLPERKVVEHLFTQEWKDAFVAGFGLVEA